MEANVFWVFRGEDSTTLVEFEIACGNKGFNWLVSRMIIPRLGNPMISFVNNTFTKVLTQNYVRSLSRLLRTSFEWCCVYDKRSLGNSNKSKMSGNIKLITRFDLL